MNYCKPKDIVVAVFDGKKLWVLLTNKFIFIFKKVEDVSFSDETIKNWFVRLQRKALTY